MLMTIFAVYGHKILGLHESEHKFKFFLVCVSRNVNIVHCVVNYVCTLSEQVVDDIVHRLFVAGNRR